jgi:hypothetical protein
MKIQTGVPSASIYFELMKNLILNIYLF